MFMGMSALRETCGFLRCNAACVAQKLPWGEEGIIDRFPRIRREINWPQISTLCEILRNICFLLACSLEPVSRPEIVARYEFCSGLMSKAFCVRYWDFFVAYLGDISLEPKTFIAQFSRTLKWSVKIVTSN